MLVRPLARELLVLILIKAFALVLLFVFFFSPAHRPKVDAEATERALLSGPAERRTAP